MVEVDEGRRLVDQCRPRASPRPRAAALILRALGDPKLRVLRVFSDLLSNRDRDRPARLALVRTLARHVAAPPRDEPPVRGLLRALVHLAARGARTARRVRMRRRPARVRRAFRRTA